MILEKINKPNDIKKLDPIEYNQLAEEIREFLIQTISKTGGHLASNLGVVELTMALHLVFNLPQDKLIWDVGHQSYTHKILTGRKAGFDGLRKFGGMSGFPKRNESNYDAFDTGHSSTSISAGLGYVYARDIKKGTGLPSSSPTGWPAPDSRTESSCWRKGKSWRWAPIRSCWRRTALTHRCIGCRAGIIRKIRRNCNKKQSRNGHARENFQMRTMQLKIAPLKGHGSVETELG